MRRVFAGPSSSNYTEKQHKVSLAIDPGVSKTCFLEKQNNDIKNNPTGGSR